MGTRWLWDAATAVKKTHKKIIKFSLSKNFGPVGIEIYKYIAYKLSVLVLINIYFRDFEKHVGSFV